MWYRLRHEIVAIMFRSGRLPRDGNIYTYSRPQGFPHLPARLDFNKPFVAGENPSQSTGRRGIGIL
jgi:hypothetical protein